MPNGSPRRANPLLLSVVAVLALGAVALAFVARSLGNGPPSARPQEPSAPCEIDPEVLLRVARGYYPQRSGDVLMTERLPNQFGTRHSTPWPYTQDVPLVLYGPGFIKRGASSTKDVTVADLAPTFAELLGFDGLGKTDGKILREALLPAGKRNGVPRLIVTVVWDGGGDNVLEQWPDSWPELQELMANGASYANATVGSSPSITSSIHATIGTGLFPKRHGISDTKMRIGNKMTDAWPGTSPKHVEAKTLADLWDAANGNEPLIGLMARDGTHAGMIGHGSYRAGGDKDIAVLDNLGGMGFRTNAKFYSLPGHVQRMEALDAAIAEVDLRDGEADRLWLGNPLLAHDPKIRYTPAFSIFQTQKLIELVEREGFGADDTADLFFVNYKSTDLAGHEWNMVEPEVRDDLAEQDRQLLVLVRALDRIVGPRNYVMAVTADHGMTPPPEATGGWNIDVREMTADIEREFDKKMPARRLVLSNRGYQLMLDRKEMEVNEVTPEEVAEFLRNYRIGENVSGGGEVPKRFADRADESIYLFAGTPDHLERALDCAREASRRDRAASTAARTRKSGLPRT